MEPHVCLEVITTLVFLKTLFEVSHHKAGATARLTCEGGPWVHLLNTISPGRRPVCTVRLWNPKTAVWQFDLVNEQPTFTRDINTTLK